MNQVQTIVIVALIVGFIVGFLVGRWLAENGSARYDMQKRWDGRQNYRKNDDN